MQHSSNNLDLLRLVHPKEPHKYCFKVRQQYESIFLDKTSILTHAIRTVAFHKINSTMAASPDWMDLGLVSSAL